jgi:6,7-dimethyl-8-ribityllumazine synthase
LHVGLANVLSHNDLELSLLKRSAGVDAIVIYGDQVYLGFVVRGSHRDFDFVCLRSRVPKQQHK